MQLTTIFPAIASLLIATLISSNAIAQADNPIDFSSQIRPILSENCFFCHGPDAKQRQSDLRLDVEDDAQHVFEAGDADASELFARINSDDPDELMPPPDSNRALSKQQITLIKRWINEGGNWGQHWAYAPIVKPDIAADKAIDFFVSRKLHQNNLQFSPEANRAMLIRRVSIDLTGIPPTVEQLNEFLVDQSAGAYEKMVERFLRSPAYGERMAWNWLDAARYADTNGYQGDNERTMWPWRDWVIQAYNDNLPFDQFSTWQLAGDLLSNATDTQILATGFNRNHPINGEGGRIAEENRIDYVMDMAETTGTLWMGLTFNCCRCHDHKYDQITQNDYFSLFAFFDQTPVTGGGGNAQTAPVLAVPDKAQRQQKQKIDRAIAEYGSQRNQHVKSIASQQPKWERLKLAKIADQSNWKIFEPSSFFASGAKIKPAAGSSLLTYGPNRDNDNYRVTGKTTLKSIHGVRLEVLNHASMTNQGLSRSPSSNFVLTDFSVFVIEPEKQPRPIEIASAQADYEQPSHSVDQAFDDDPKTGWAVYSQDKDRRQEHEAIFAFSKPVPIPDDAEIKIVLKHESVHKRHNIGRFRISFTDREDPGLLGSNSKLVAALETPTASRSEEQNKLVRLAFLKTNSRYLDFEKQIQTERAKLKSLNKLIPNVMVMADMPNPRKSYRLNRGSYQQPLNEVFARVPEMLKPIPENAKPNRLALANWLFEKSNPLTPRVTVNRLWAQFFGIGMVKTTENFGVQGEPPSHPELLDWLAAEYRDSGWDTKHMIRLFVTSQTYRQSSKTSPRLRELDPENRLLARGARFRMPSWMIRDHALAVSGRLVSTIGGKPVNSYQPAGVWEESSFGKKKYNRGTGDELYRRSIYTFWRRIAAPTMIFDNADRMTCSVTTYRTNTPLHALSTLNDVTFVEASRLLATDVLHLKLNEQQSLRLIFKRVVVRSIKPDEETILLAALERARKQFRADSKSANLFLAIGETPPDHQIETVELASWTSLCLAVLNLDEALTRQ